MQRGLLFFGFVSLTSLLLLFSSAMAFGGVTEFYGDIVDAEGKRLYPTAGDNFWVGKDGQRFDIDPGETNAIVAFSLDGRELGTGRISGVDYQLNLRDSSDNVILIYAGFYDVVRPDRTQLLYCTTLDISTLPFSRKILSNIKCEGITLYEGATGSYR